MGQTAGLGHHTRTMGDVPGRPDAPGTIGWDRQQDWGIIPGQWVMSQDVLMSLGQ